MKVRHAVPVLTLILSLFAATASAQSPGVDDLIQRLESKYASIKTLRAEFSQTITSAFNDESATISGTLMLSGKKYRYETPSQTFVTDGVSAWIYLPDENQVLINDYDAEESTFSPDQFFVDYEKNYNVALQGTRTIDGQQHFVMELTPKTPDSFFQTSTVFMRAQDDLITRMEVLDVNDTRLLFELDNIELNPTLPAGVFTFKPPTGTEVINLRS